MFISPILPGCSNNQNGITGGNSLIQHQVTGTGHTNSHQNMSINGINSGHSSNTGIIHGASGNVTSGGFGSISSGSTYSTSGFAQSSHGVGNGNTVSSSKGIILQNLIESNNYQVTHGICFITPRFARYG